MPRGFESAADEADDAVADDDDAGVGEDEGGIGVGVDPLPLANMILVFATSNGVVTAALTAPATLPQAAAYPAGNLSTAAASKSDSIRGSRGEVGCRCGSRWRRRERRSLRCSYRGNWMMQNGIYPHPHSHQLRSSPPTLHGRGRTSLATVLPKPLYNSRTPPSLHTFPAAWKEEV